MADVRAECEIVTKFLLNSCRVRQCDYVSECRFADDMRLLYVDRLTTTKLGTFR